MLRDGCVTVVSLKRPGIKNSRLNVFTSNRLLACRWLSRRTATAAFFVGRVANSTRRLDRRAARNTETWAGTETRPYSSMV